MNPPFFFSFAKQLWIFSRNSWVLTRQLARSIMLHADSGWYISICTACCLPVSNYGMWGGDANRQGSLGSGLSLWLGRHFSLLCFESSWLYGTPTNQFTLEAFPHEEHLTQGSPLSTRCRIWLPSGVAMLLVHMDFRSFPALFLLFSIYFKTRMFYCVSFNSILCIKPINALQTSCNQIFPYLTLDFSLEQHPIIEGVAGGQGLDALREMDCTVSFISLPRS